MLKVQSKIERNENPHDNNTMRDAIHFQIYIHISSTMKCACMLIYSIAKTERMSMKERKRTSERFIIEFSG